MNWIERGEGEIGGGHPVVVVVVVVTGGGAQESGGMRKSDWRDDTANAT